MNTIFLTVVLAAPAGQDAAPTWHTSYDQAQQQGMTQKKPLAVFFGTGAKGWVSTGSDDDSEVAQLLRANYICVYANLDTAAGKKLAQDFAITAKSGVVLSDRSGSTQAFWHSGNLPNDRLASYLQKYADPNVAVNGTETISRSRTSFYPSGGSAPSNPSYCPNCSNLHMRR
ncbi:MAG TPA: hypothetical protein VKE98_01180 [Gemmataceae bacterium]|nr:hypothetical protein [Gemmataceae bacterium]